jgi:hypothetical protein
LLTLQITLMYTCQIIYWRTCLPSILTHIVSGRRPKGSWRNFSGLLENVLQRQFPGLKAEVGMNNEIWIEVSRKWENWQWYRKKMTESATILHLRYLKNMQNIATYVFFSFITQRLMSEFSCIHCFKTGAAFNVLFLFSVCGSLLCAFPPPPPPPI